MSFLVKDEKVLTKYNGIWSKINTIIGRKRFDSNLVFCDRYLKIKTKSYNNKITTNFHSRTPKSGIDCVCLSVLAIDCVFRSRKSYYPKTFLEG